jgi:hypothetical protein
VIKNKSHSIANATATLKVNLNLANNLNIGFDYLEIDKIKIPVINKEDNYIGKIKELFSPSYFQSNVKGGIGKTVFETSNNIEPNYFVIRSDGSYSLQRELLIDSLKVKKKSKDFIEVHKDHFFLESDTLNIYFNYFKKLLLVLKRDNVIPIVYISPINPIVYDKLVKNSVVPIESAIKYFCEMNGILIIGSFNPHKYGIHFSGKKFSDAYHPTKSVVESIFYYHKAELEEIGIISTKESF